jgi:3-deoxy-D-manno-octulosonic-acid transferase
VRRRMVWEWGYTLVLWAALPFIVARLLWRGRREPGYRRHVAERFGKYRARPQKPVIWVHAVSMGETRAAEPLVRLLAGIRMRNADHTDDCHRTIPRNVVRRGHARLATL